MGAVAASLTGAALGLLGRWLVVRSGLSERLWRGASS